MVVQSKPLSRPEAWTIQFIDQYVKENGYPPTVREMTSEFGYKSTATIFEALRRLEGKGHIQLKDRVARGIRVLTTPDQWDY